MNDKRIWAIGTSYATVNDAITRRHKNRIRSSQPSQMIQHFSISSKLARKKSANKSIGNVAIATNWNNSALNSWVNSDITIGHQRFKRWFIASRCIKMRKKPGNPTDLILWSLFFFCSFAYFLSSHYIFELCYFARKRRFWCYNQIFHDCIYGWIESQIRNLLDFQQNGNGWSCRPLEHIIIITAIVISWTDSSISTGHSEIVWLFSSNYFVSVHRIRKCSSSMYVKSKTYPTEHWTNLFNVSKADDTAHCITDPKIIFFSEISSYLHIKEHENMFAF